MTWRFRKTFKLLPGVKLNLTARGLSATLGASPFSLNIGPRGVYRNIDIPGTGIWDRQRIHLPSSGISNPVLPQPPVSAAVNPSPTALPPTAPFAPETQMPEIHSASTELLNSISLEELRKLLRQTYDERAALSQEIASAETELKAATERYETWNRGFLLKRVFRRAFATRSETWQTSQAKLKELHEQLDLTTLATNIDIEREQAEPFYQMRDQFAALSESKKIWDTLARQQVDRFVTRSAATESLTRTPVSFALGDCDLIHWDQKVPHLPNAIGGDMYLYPGFILYRASKQAFALIESREVSVSFAPVNFIEEDGIPTDSKVVAQVWAKSNKDGTPDRRFHDNYQIPVAVYGALTLTSPSGLHEEYQLSNPELAERFAKSWDAFRASFVQPADAPKEAS